MKMKEDGRAGYTSLFTVLTPLKNLSVIREFDPWKSPLCTCPRKYSLHPYTGCSHYCLYCYATSYIGLKPSTPKERLLVKLTRDISVIPRGSIIELSTSSDPYPPIERLMGLTRKALELLSKSGFRILITTKSDIVVRDIDILANSNSAVMLTITTLNSELAKIIEPGAPDPRDRLRSLRTLAEHGVPVGVRVDPIIPFINDDPGELLELIDTVADAGARHIVTSTYKAKWDSLKRLRSRLPDGVGWRISELFREKGVFIHGYYYLPSNMRRQLLEPVIKRAKKHNLTYATCREGFPELHNAPSCDGSHLANHVKTGR
jgi:DNA repair photolyase